MFRFCYKLFCRINIVFNDTAINSFIFIILLGTCFQVILIGWNQTTVDSPAQIWIVPYISNNSKPYISGFNWGQQGISKDGVRTRKNTKHYGCPEIIHYIRPINVINTRSDVESINVIGFPTTCANRNHNAVFTQVCLDPFTDAISWGPGIAYAQTTKAWEVVAVIVA